VFAAQAVVGVSFDVNETWTTAFAYRFFAALGAEFDAGGPLDDSAGADFFSHALRFEARYRF
jgi:opacity protein-like surface antigen